MTWVGGERITEEDICKLYAEALREQTIKKSTPKKSGGWSAKEWSDEEKHLLRNTWVDLEDTVVGTIRVNASCSSEHIAEIVVRQVWRHKIPDEIWDAFVKNVRSLRRELAS